MKVYQVTWISYDNFGEQKESCIVLCKSKSEAEQMVRKLFPSAPEKLTFEWLRKECVVNHYTYDHVSTWC